MIRASLVVFIASFCTLVVELVAGRVLAPYVGVSLYTWTSIIGVVLAGISAGAYAGGRLADRRPAPSTLGWLLLASGVTAMLIAPATQFLGGDEGLLSSMGLATTLLSRVVVLSFLLFFLPSFFLGMISPVAVKLAVGDLATAGSVVGKIYAFSTLGSIAGTFLTGFVFVAQFGTKATLIGVGVALIASALLFGGFFGRRGQIGAVLIVLGGLAYGGLRSGGDAPPPYRDPLLPAAEMGQIHFEESQYYTIRVARTVREDTGGALHELQLDHLVHSYADLDDPLYLEYGYLKIFNDVVEWAARERAPARLLFIGGGGYTLPRLVSETHPLTEIDVVEIDPAVTRVAARYFGVPRDAPIRTINEDARWFAMRAREPYDVIFVDAFNDLSVPYHLTTREAAQSLERLLTPGGAIVVNLIDDYRRGRFLASYVRTLQAVFGERNVGVIAEAVEDLSSDRSTFVIVASESLPSIFGPEANGAMLQQTQIAAYLKARGAIVLTDDYAPVDNMLAPLFAGRFVDEQGE